MSIIMKDETRQKVMLRGITASVCIYIAYSIFSKLVETFSERVKVIRRGYPLLCEIPRSQFSIMTYNILSTERATRQHFPFCSEDYLRWDYRWPRLKRLLQQTRPEILCLQEIDVDHAAEVHTFMTFIGYSGYIQNKTVQGPCVGTYYQAHRFNAVWVEEQAKSVTLALETKNAPSTFMLHVVNVHLTAAPYQAKERFQQLHYTLTRVDRHLDKLGLDPATSPIVVAGDFTCGRECAPYHYCLRGRIPSGFTEVLSVGDDGEPITTSASSAPRASTVHLEITKAGCSHPYPLSDVYERAKYPLGYTRGGVGGGQVSDFILVSRWCDVASVLEPVSPKHWKLIGGEYGQMLPNRVYTSDHLALGAIVSIPERYRQVYVPPRFQ